MFFEIVGLRNTSIAQPYYLSSRWIWVVSMGVTFTDSIISPVNQKFDLIILSDFLCFLDSFCLSQTCLNDAFCTFGHYIA